MQKANFILIFILIFIPVFQAEQTYEEKALNYDSYIQSNTSYITFFLTILTLILGIAGFFGWKNINELKLSIKRQIESELRENQLPNLKEDITRDLMMTYDRDQSKVREELNNLKEDIEVYKGLIKLNEEKIHKGGK